MTLKEVAAVIDGLQRPHLECPAIGVQANQAVPVFELESAAAAHDETSAVIRVDQRPELSRAVGCELCELDPSLAFFKLLLPMACDAEVLSAARRRHKCGRAACWYSCRRRRCRPWRRRRLRLRRRSRLRRRRRGALAITGVARRLQPNDQQQETVLNLPRRCAGIRVASGLRPEAKYGVETNGPTQRPPYTVARGSKAHTSVARYAPQDDGVF